MQYLDHYLNMDKKKWLQFTRTMERHNNHLYIRFCFSDAIQIADYFIYWTINNHLNTGLAHY